MAVGNPQWGECRAGGVFLLLPQPVSPAVLHSLTTRVPSTRRRHNELTRQWWISDSYLETVEEILRVHYPAYDPYARA